MKRLAFPNQEFNDSQQNTSFSIFARASVAIRRISEKFLELNNFQAVKLVQGAVDLSDIQTTFENPYLSQ